jgi:large subunit ribosomal protein L18
VAQAHYRELGKKAKNTLKEAAAVGRLLGERLAKHGLNQAVFDRAGYLYHGKIKAAANGIRESGVTM